MKLSAYLDAKKISLTKMAESLGVSVQAVWQYTHTDRVPRPDIMTKIVEVTKGAVQPNDFYPETHAAE